VAIYIYLLRRRRGGLVHERQTKLGKARASVTLGTDKVKREVNNETCLQDPHPLSVSFSQQRSRLLKNQASMTHMRGIVDVQDIVDGKADQSSIKKRTIEGMSLVDSETTWDVPGLQNDRVAVKGHGEVVAPVMDGLHRRLIHAGIETTVFRRVSTKVNLRVASGGGCAYLRRVVLPAVLSPTTAMRTRFGPTEEARLRPARKVERLG
jgi:hypothetical protein